MVNGSIYRHYYRPTFWQQQGRVYIYGLVEPGSEVGNVRAWIMGHFIFGWNWILVGILGLRRTVFNDFSIRSQISWYSIISKNYGFWLLGMVDIEPKACCSHTTQLTSRMIWLNPAITRANYTAFVCKLATTSSEQLGLYSMLQWTDPHSAIFG